MEEDIKQALVSLITKMADDELILGHRNSEWTGLGPVMEEDIAFSSMAQDKLGHALALYQILHEELGGKDPDQVAFLRPAEKFCCCHLVEFPNGEYDFSLMRHFLFDAAETVRYASLENSEFPPFRQLARKFKGELKYHMMHANAWIHQLSHGGDESHELMQASVSRCFGLALGIFESLESDRHLVANNIYPGEEMLRDRWLENIYPVLSQAGLNMPSPEDTTPAYSGRNHIHTPYLQPLLDEMGQVFRLDAAASW